MECITLNKSNCKNCYKCIRHCSVKSIRFSGSQAHIIEDECIHCGHCYVICPQNARVIVDDTEKVKVLLQSKSPVIASLAPSFIANYEGVEVEAMREALKKLGFADVEETAMGATIIKKEYERMLNEDERDIIITSCCHSVNLLIQKYYPSLLPYLADVLSPMQAHCQDIKRRIPNAKTVFIGPCVAKKDEVAEYPGFVDAVLTYDELSAWLEAEGIILEKKKDTSKDGRTRLFPTTGGVLKSMDLNNPDYTYIAIDGVKNCISALKDIEKDNLHNCFIEMSACVGSCINGPVMEKNHHSPVKDYVSVSNYAGKNDFIVEQPTPNTLKKYFEHIQHISLNPTEADITQTLRQMGKETKEDELNCGSCGYDSCRDKAIAILQGKAEISMCLPFLRGKAESFSNTISNITPNAIVVLNENLEIQDVNHAAIELFNLHSPNDVLGEQVIRILNPRDFLTALDSSSSFHSSHEYLAEYKKYVDKTIIHNSEYHIILCILRDITDEENQRKSKEEFNKKTIEIADNVVDNQMKIVQEIASLLGETAAETKVALTKLKESLSDE